MNQERDIKLKMTTVGPHRDDFSFMVTKLDEEGNPVEEPIDIRKFGSQGQQRSAALSLKLGEAAVIKSFSSEQPVALLDDVMSELDETRQNYILNHIKDWQVFITCCDPSTVKNLKSGKKIELKGGKIK